MFYPTHEDRLGCYQFLDTTGGKLDWIGQGRKAQSFIERSIFEMFKFRTIPVWLMALEVLGDGKWHTMRALRRATWKRASYSDLKWALMQRLRSRGLVEKAIHPNYPIGFKLKGHRGPQPIKNIWRITPKGKEVLGEMNFYIENTFFRMLK